MTRHWQRVPERVGVLDNSVVDHTDSTGAIRVRMRVAFGNRSVCCPPGVTDAHPIEFGFGPGPNRTIECADSVNRPEPRDVAVRRLHSDANRVVTAVLEPAECGEEIVERRRMRPARDDATHDPIS